MSRSCLAWHFLQEDGHTRWNRQKVEPGQTLKWAGHTVEVLDLSAAAFRELCPLHGGVIHITAEVVE